MITLFSELTQWWCHWPEPGLTRHHWHEIKLICKHELTQHTTQSRWDTELSEQSQPGLGEFTWRVLSSWLSLSQLSPSLLNLIFMAAHSSSTRSLGSGRESILMEVWCVCDQGPGLSRTEAPAPAPSPLTPAAGPTMEDSNYGGGPGGKMSE